MGLCLSKAAANGGGSEGGAAAAEAAEAWFVTSKPMPDAKQRLFCLPWEGGGSLAFSSHWVVPFTEVVAVEAPGRMG
jgi:hypothetical protein